MDNRMVNKDINHLIFIVGVFVLLLLSLVNIKTVFSKKEVLGLETQIQSDDKFWNDFLIKNPNYLPGWVELGKADVASKIDPNYWGLEH